MRSHRSSRKSYPGGVWLFAFGASLSACTYDFDRWVSDGEVRPNAGATNQGNWAGTGNTLGPSGNGGTGLNQAGGSARAVNTAGLAGSANRAGGDFGAAGSAQTRGGASGNNSGNAGRSGLNQFGTAGSIKAEGGGTFSRGGNTGTSAHGGASNSGATTSAMNGGTGAGSSTNNSATCAGAGLDGICWYLGTQGSSCQQTCSTHGQPASNADGYVGSPLQGGSLSMCATLLGLLGVSGTPTGGLRIDGRGLGCHVNNGSELLWLMTPNYSAADSLASARLVCGCTQ